MKRVKDCTQKELAEMVEVDIQRLIDIEIAFEGIEPAICPTEPSLDDEGIIKSEIAYEVAGIKVLSKEDAITISKMKIVRSDYEYSIGYDYKWLTTVLDPKIEEKSYYRKEDISRIAKTIQDNEQKRKEYEKQQDKYEKWMKATGNIRAEVWKRVNQAKRYMADVAMAQEAFQRYLDLAENNYEIAKKFFRDAYKNRPEMIKEILDENVGPTKEEGNE